MKKTLLPTAFIFLVSCYSRSEYFNGFGELKLGNDINSIESAKLFVKEKDGIYKIERFKLSNEIGYVRNLQVKTDGGEVYEVSFESDETTNSKYIDSVLESLQKYNLLHVVANPDVPFDVTEFSDGKVDFSKSFDKNRTAQDNTVDYRYFDIRKAID